MLGLLVGIVFNLGLFFIWLLLIYFLKRDETIILLGLKLSILVFILGYFIEQIPVLLGIALEAEQMKIIVAPIAEESSKYFFIFLACLKHDFGELTWREIIQFGATIGLGFAFFENFGFIENLSVVLLRGISSWILHVGTSILLAFSVGYALKSKPKLVWDLTPFLFWLAILLHAMFNQIFLVLGVG